MKRLQLSDFPFHQNALIEASAGTGKTYTISNLYLRLILGDNCTARNVQDILVLTFTNAATGELKERILDRIRQAWRDFSRGKSQDAFIAQLIEETKDKEVASQRLLVAANDMDLASVFTIHGFCQRLLTEYAFESGAAWDEDLLLDDSEMLLNAATDYWRKFIVNLKPDEARWYLQKWPAPEALAKKLRSIVYRDIGQPDPNILLEQWQSAKREYQQLIEQTRQWWSQNDISGVLENADLKANVKLGKGPFLALIRQFAVGELSLADLQVSFGKDGWLALSPEQVTKARKKSSAEIDTGPFEVFVQLAEMQSREDNLRQQYYFWHSLIFVRQHLQVNKSKQAEISPDDLLTRVKNALMENDGSLEITSSLKNIIRDKFPIAMVDEFQDTDQTQFDIFRTLYEPTAGDEKTECALIMIGDPKQAIYSFRGGDIYTYLRAKNFVGEEARYTLDTNWRSQPALVSAVNAFFSYSETGFMHENMPFYPVEAGKSQKTLLLSEEPLAAVTCRVLSASDPGSSIKWSEASLQSAQHCALAIQYYLTLATVDGKPCEAADICVLVRDRFEASLVQSALQKVKIDSVFLLKDTVFNSPVAYSLGLIINAIDESQSESQIKAVLLDRLFGFSHESLAKLNANTWRWQECLEIFHKASDIWSYRGVMSAVEFVCRSFSVYEKVKTGFEQYQRTITDIRHLCEILQQQSTRVEGRSALVAWFQERVARPELLAADGLDDTQWRLETDQNLVQISTIHASKGLQYPFVFIPFVSRYKDVESSFYHDESQSLRYNITKDEEVNEKQVKERLSEDIRLLYVALTRAELHCWLGIWNNNIPGRKVQSGFVNTAFGKLLDIAAGEEPHQEWILQRLQNRFAKENVSLALANDEEYETQSLSYSDDINNEAETHSLASLNLAAKTLSSGISQTWQMTSYSAISKTRVVEENTEYQEELKASDETLMVDEQTTQESEVLESIEEPLPLELLPMRFRFARGASPGSYLHEVLEYSDFQELSSVRTHALEFTDKFSIDTEQVPEIADWLVETLNTPVNERGEEPYCLADITQKHRIPEMEFYLPLDTVDMSEFNRLVSEWLSDICLQDEQVSKDGQVSIEKQPGHYKIHQLNGMLKGYLDLVYVKGQRIYVADYKSNYLGESFDDYQEQALHGSMLHHDYYLQALLYTLAMHRFMGNKIKDYNYQKHIGGAQYLFLRGMSPEKPGCGVRTVKPPETLIENLDALFDARVFDHNLEGAC